jgi:hypothetical protein
MKTFPTPKRITELWKGWYKAAKTAWPDLPHIQETGGAEPDVRGQLWKLYEEPMISPEYIGIRLVNQFGQRITITIARKTNPLGR